MDMRTTGRKGDRELDNGWVGLTAQNPQLNRGLTEGEMQTACQSLPQHAEGLLPGGGA